MSGAASPPKRTPARSVPRRCSFQTPSERAARRKAVFRKGGGRCYYCGEPIFIDAYFEIDHIEPRANGGSSEIENLAPSCHECNHAKGNLNPDQWRAKMLRENGNMVRSSVRFSHRPWPHLKTVVRQPGTTIVFFFEAPQDYVRRDREREKVTA